MNLKTDCNNHAKHYYISDSDFMLNYTPYEQDQYNGRCYFLEDSRSFTSQAAREGGLVRRRISKADYEAALAECMAILSDEKQVPAIDKDKILSDLVMVSDLTREGGTTPRISADNMIADFDKELRAQIDDPHYPTIDLETARHELLGFMTALKELSIVDKDRCYVRPNHFGTLTYFPQIGELLRNGHTVDAAYSVGCNRYVLAHRDGAPEPYAVWEVSRDGDTYGGRYFTDQTRAQKYFASCCYDWSEYEKEQEIVQPKTDFGNQMRSETKQMVVLTHEIESIIDQIESKFMLHQIVHFWWERNRNRLSTESMKITLGLMYHHFLEDQEIF